MLHFYKSETQVVNVHLDLDISELTMNIQTTHNPFALLTNNVEVVESFDFWKLPNDIFMTVPQLYAFCQEWFNLCPNLQDLINYDDWFKLYLKSEIEALNSESYDLTYYDSIKLYHLKRYIKNFDNYKCDTNPVKFMPANAIPELSWMVTLFLNGKGEQYAERINAHIRETQQTVRNNIQKVNYLCGELIPNAENFLPQINQVKHLDFKKPRTIMYFVNPFTLTDSITNFSYLKKVLIKEGRKYEANHNLHNANIPL